MMQSMVRVHQMKPIMTRAQSRLYALADMSMAVIIIQVSNEIYIPP